MTAPASVLLWIGAALLYAALRPGRERTPAALAASAVGGAFVVAGFSFALEQSAGTGAAIGEAVAHLTAAATLLAIVVPLLRGRGASRREVRIAAGRGKLADRSPRYGAARLAAAALAAPGAALLVALALPRLIPASQDLRYLVACIAVVPLMALAPLVALRARSGRRAWMAAGLVAAATVPVLWSALS